MNTKTVALIGKAEKAVRSLLEECHKNGLLYCSNPRAVAQVNRTGKWFLSAVAQLADQPTLNKETDQ